MKFQSSYKTIPVKFFMMTLFAAMAIPAGVLAQSTANSKKPATHHHYKLVDMGTLGGPFSGSGWPFGLNINSHGTVITLAETAFGCPTAPNCLQQTQDNLVNHGLQWKNGVLTDMGALPGGNNSSFPGWINDRGDSVGISTNNLYDPLTGYPEFRAVLWKDGKIFDLGTLGGNVSLANAINNRGEVVGNALNSIPDNDSNFGWSPAAVATQFRAFLWQAGVMHDLGTLGTGNNAVALFINDPGQVAGVSLTNTSANSPTGIPTQDPFFWENGKMVDIGTLGGTSGTPWFMNNQGQVVGVSNLAGDQTGHAFVWDKENGLKDLGTLPGRSNSIATWINGEGEIVGVAEFFNGGSSILWKNGKMIDLGKLSGDCSSEALAINSKGQMIGNSSPDCQSDGVGVIWEDGGAPVDLNTLVTPLSDINVAFPVSLNDRGEIVAHGVLPNGDVHSVILIPCDDDHAEVEGCDYQTVAAVPLGAAPINKSSVAGTLSYPPTFETAKRLHARKADHDRRS